MKFVRAESTAGMVLVVFALAAIVLCNSPFNHQFTSFWSSEFGIAFGEWKLSKPLAVWVNECLMTFFFLVVGLEIKRELAVGELSTFKKAILPIVAAAGGVIIPSLIYICFTYGTNYSDGWAIPTSTDIAFCLAALSLLGKRIPLGLKVFVAASAIVDDLVGILILSVFYSHGLNVQSLLLSAFPLFMLLLINRLDCRQPLPYCILGFWLWTIFLHAGLHATVAGVLIALFVPVSPKLNPVDFESEISRQLGRFTDIRSSDDWEAVNSKRKSAILAIESISVHAQSPLQRMEAGFHPWVAFLVLPLFALANAGVSLSVVNDLSEHLSLSMAIIAGLLIGKPLGMSLFSCLALRTGLASLPAGVSLGHLLGASILSGVGFTMSLFMASLAFESSNLLEISRFSILVSSAISWVAGIALLVCASRASSRTDSGCTDRVLAKTR